MGGGGGGRTRGGRLRRGGCSITNTTGELYVASSQNNRQHCCSFYVAFVGRKAIRCMLKVQNSSGKQCVADVVTLTIHRLENGLRPQPLQRTSVNRWGRYPHSVYPPPAPPPPPPFRPPSHTHTHSHTPPLQKER